jgi:prephenate dehydrogenase
MWETTGARCVTLSAKDHDRFLALTSHLPHLISFGYFQLVNDAARRSPILRALVAGSFRDMTRVAGADADMWTGVVDLNRRELRAAKIRFSRSVNALIRSSNTRLRGAIGRLSAAKKKWPPRRP